MATVCSSRHLQTAGAQSCTCMDCMCMDCMCMDCMCMDCMCMGLHMHMPKYRLPIGLHMHGLPVVQETRCTRQQAAGAMHLLRDLFPWWHGQRLEQYRHKLLVIYVPTPVGIRLRHHLLHLVFIDLLAQVTQNVSQLSAGTGGTGTAVIRSAVGAAGVRPPGHGSLSVWASSRGRDLAATLLVED